MLVGPTTVKAAEPPPMVTALALVKFVPVIVNRRAARGRTAGWRNCGDGGRRRIRVEARASGPCRRVS